MKRFTQAIALGVAAYLFAGSAAVMAAANVCQSAAREIVDATQKYRGAVREVSVQCSKASSACTTARTAADAALNVVGTKHAEMMNQCVAPPPPPPPGGGYGRLVLNEVDYDQPGTDWAEFVEIYNAGAEPASLDGIAVVFVNGNDGAEYSRINLSGTLNAGGYAVIATSRVNPAAGALVFPFPLSANNIQNGSPDGIAIIDTYTGAVLDALSYGGYITNANIAGVGPVSLVEGVATSVTDSSFIAGSMVRLPNGYDTDDAAADWRLTVTPTPGAPNVP